MKKLLLILLCLPMIGFGQQVTMIPDSNFEQRLISFGYDNVLDGTVLTAAIDTVTHLEVSYYGISDLTGIEDFTDLTELFCANNNLTSLDISQNTALDYLDCYDNQLTSLDVSTNTALTHLHCAVNQLTSLDVSQNTALNLLFCYHNQLTNLDVSNNTALVELICYFNQLTSLDISNNTALTYLSCETNQLTSLDVSGATALNLLFCYSNQLTSFDVSQNTALTNLGCNGNQLTSLDLSDNTSLVYLSCGNSQLQCLNIANGNNLNLGDCSIWNSPLLTCIEADDSTYMNNNWQSHFGPINSQYYFSNHCNNDCSLTYIEEHSRNKELLKVTNLLGRETKGTNQPLFYIYDDGTVEKRIVIE